MAVRKEYRIHPALGIARVGNSPDTYYVAPEAPTDRFDPPKETFAPVMGPLPSGYRDSANRILKQGARFRIFEYTYKRKSDRYPKTVKEITNNTHDIEWTVHLGNRKSMIDNPARTENPNIPAKKKLQTPAAAGPVPHMVPEEVKKAGRLRLGYVKLDGDGQFLVIGSDGATDKDPAHEAISNHLFHAGWHDDTADGPVTARIRKKGDLTWNAKVEPAWVVISVPDYGADINAFVTVWDMSLSLGLRGKPIKSKPSFLNSIYPLLERSRDVSFVHSSGSLHSAGSIADIFSVAELMKLGTIGLDAAAKAAHKTRRKEIMERIRPPFPSSYVPPNLRAGDPIPNLPISPKNMPFLVNLPFTKLQYKELNRWNGGKFTDAWAGVIPVYPSFSALADKDKPAAMDRAHMDSMCGGSFLPGIEVGRDVEDPRIWKKHRGTRKGTWQVRLDQEKIDADPNKRPGYLTRGLAVPWQGDFALCDEQYWPASRPGVARDSIAGSAYNWLDDSAGNGIGPADMPAKWQELGFIRRQAGGELIEDERVRSHS